jgi:hypothetical protein
MQLIFKTTANYAHERQTISYWIFIGVCNGTILNKGDGNKNVDAHSNRYGHEICKKYASERSDTCNTWHVLFNKALGTNIAGRQVYWYVT